MCVFIFGLFGSEGLSYDEHIGRVLQLHAESHTCVN